MPEQQVIEIQMCEQHAAVHGLLFALWETPAARRRSEQTRLRLAQHSPVGVLITSGLHEGEGREHGG